MKQDIFPPVIFKWGEEIERSNQMERKRNKGYWGIGVATLVNLAVNVLFWVTTK
jgi:hypothetical protein